METFPHPQATSNSKSFFHGVEDITGSDYPVISLIATIQHFHYLFQAQIDQTFSISITLLNSDTKERYSAKIPLKNQNLSIIYFVSLFYNVKYFHQPFKSSQTIFSPWHLEIHNIESSRPYLHFYHENSTQYLHSINLKKDPSSINISPILREEIRLHIAKPNNTLSKIDLVHTFLYTKSCEKEVFTDEILYSKEFDHVSFLAIGRDYFIYKCKLISKRDLRIISEFPIEIYDGGLHHSAVYCTKDKLLYTCDFEKIHIYHVPQKKKIHTMKCHRSIDSISYDTLNDYLLVYTWKAALSIYSNNFEFIKKIEFGVGFADCILDAQIHENYVYACDEKGTIYKADLDSGKIVSQKDLHTDWIRAIRLVGPNILLSCSDDGKIKVFNFKTNKKATISTLTPQSCISCILKYSSKIYSFAGNDGIILIIDISTRKVIKRIQIGVPILHLSRDSQNSYACTRDGIIVQCN